MPYEDKLDKFGRRLTCDGQPINPDMGEGRYQDLLRRQRARVASNEELSMVDSTTIGDKYTEASWGLCCNDKEGYPTAMDQTFPSDFVMHKRQSSRDPPDKATCPFDRARFKPDPFNMGLSGCFYRCMLFRPVKGQLPIRGGKVAATARAPTQKEALKLYDDLIAEREKVFGKKKTADDGESKWTSSRVKGARR